MSTKVKPAIVVFLASNCEKDLAKVLKEFYKLEPQMVFHDQRFFTKDITHIILPGGFSFGDYLRCGAIAALSPIMHAVKEWALLKKPILGICNGFQILCEAKLLPGALLKNNHDRFICSVEQMTWFGAKRPLEKPMNIKLPVAHREGRYYADQSTLAMLEENHQIILRYQKRDALGQALVNGSKNAIAGIMGGPVNNVFGLMPHPERMMDENLMGTDGRMILEDFLFG